MTPVDAMDRAMIAVLAELRRARDAMLCVYDEDIAELRSEALAAGDMRMAELCADALEGGHSARVCCERVIVAARKEALT